MVSCSSDVSFANSSIASIQLQIQQNKPLNTYTRQSQLEDNKFKQRTTRKNRLYRECRDLVKSVKMSWKEAEREYIEKGNEITQAFHDQHAHMVQYEKDIKQSGLEFVDAPAYALDKEALVQAFDPILTHKTHQQIDKEKSI
eukprot:530973_1